MNKTILDTIEAYIAANRQARPRAEDVREIRELCFESGERSVEYLAAYTTGLREKKR